VSPNDRRVSRAIVVLLLCATAWSAGLVCAPLAARAERGSPALVAAAIVYTAGGIVCHQRPERSFHTGDVQWPVCARCAGLYLAAGGAALFVMLGGDRTAAATLPRAGPPMLLLIAGAPTAISWIAERLHIVAPSNAWRALLALPLGLVVPILLARARARAETAREHEVNSTRA
jgi:uncharacterized membrane protein